MAELLQETKSKISSPLIKQVSRHKRPVSVPRRKPSCSTPDGNGVPSCRFCSHIDCTVAGLPDFETLVLDGGSGAIERPHFPAALLMVINMVGRAIAEHQAAD